MVLLREVLLRLNQNGPSFWEVKGLVMIQGGR